MDAQPRQTVYVFGDFRLDPAARRLSGSDGRPLPLTPRVFDTLHFLVLHAGEVCTKSALMRAVWPNVVVEEGSLQQAVHELRRALGEQRRGHRYIATVPGRGYQFVAAVAPCPREVVAAGLEVRGEDRGTGASPSRARWAGLAAATLIGACVLAAAGYAYHARRNAQGAASDVAAAAVPEPIQLARFLADRRQPGDLALAERAFKQALARDPRDARAWAGLAGVYSNAVAAGNALGLSRPEALARWRDATDRALALDPAQEDALLRRAEYLAETGDRAAYTAAVREAAARSSHGALALGWIASDALDEGRVQDAVAALRLAVSREPMSLVARCNLGAALYFAGLFEEAAAELRTVLHLANPAGTAWSPVDDPANPATNAGIGLVKALIAMHRPDEAQALLATWPEGQYRMHCLALLLFARGDRAGADAVLEKLVAAQPSEPHWVAEVFAQRGEIDAAFEWMDRAVQRSRATGDTAQLWRRDLRYSPFMGQLRADPRWNDWLAGPTRVAVR